LPEISNDIADDGDDWEVKPSIFEDANNLRQRFENIWKKQVPMNLRNVIKSGFVEELK
jgi:hypothetical protein